MVTDLWSEEGGMSWCECKSNRQHLLFARLKVTTSESTFQPNDSTVKNSRNTMQCHESLSYKSLCKKHGLESSDRWYERTPADGENEVELYWDLTIQTHTTDSCTQQASYYSSWEGNGQSMILLFQVTSM